jgi:CBS domain-containing protein
MKPIDHDTLIAHVMTHLPLTIEGSKPVKRAKEILYQYKFKHLPVLCDGVLHGILTDRDLKLAYATADDKAELDSWPVERICVTETCTVPKDTPLLEVLETMTHRDIGSVIVIENGVPVGIFTLSDCAIVLKRVLGKNKDQQ